MFRYYVAQNIVKFWCEWPFPWCHHLHKPIEFYRERLKLLFLAALQMLFIRPFFPGSQLTMPTSREKRPQPTAAERLNPDPGPSGSGKQVCRQKSGRVGPAEQVLISENCGTCSAPARLETEPGGQILQLCNRGCLLAHHWFCSTVIPLVLRRARQPISAIPAQPFHRNQACTSNTISSSFLPETQTHQSMKTQNIPI